MARARATRFREEHGNYCHWCEWRDWVIRKKRPRIVWRAHLSVHHGYGRGWRSPLGQEGDDELYVACRRCHARITRRQFHLAIRRGACARNRAILDRASYARCVWQATEEASIRRWARGWHRTLLGPVPERVRTYVPT